MAQQQHVLIETSTPREYENKPQNEWFYLQQNKTFFFKLKLGKEIPSSKQADLLAKTWASIQKNPNECPYFAVFFWDRIISKLSLQQVKELIERQFTSVRSFLQTIETAHDKSNMKEMVKDKMKKLMILITDLTGENDKVSAFFKVDDFEFKKEYPMNTSVSRSDLLQLIKNETRKNELDFSHYCMYVNTPGKALYPAQASIQIEQVDITVTLKKIPELKNAIPYSFSSPEIEQWVNRILSTPINDISFLEHLRSTPQLGIASLTNDYCHHTRFNYLQQFITNLNYLQWGGSYKGEYSRRDLFVLWFIISQFGHTADAYIGERYLVWHLQQSQTAIDELIKYGKLEGEDAERLTKIAKNGEWTLIYPLLAIIRLKTCNMADIVEAYKLMDRDDYATERKVFHIVRKLTFLDLDTRFSFANIQVNVVKELTSVMRGKHEINEEQLAATESLCEKLIRELQESLYVVPAVPVTMQALSQMSTTFSAHSGSTLLKQLFANKITLQLEHSLNSLFSLLFPVSDLKKSSTEVTNSPVIQEAQKVINKTWRIKCKAGVFKWKVFTHEWSKSFTEYFFLSSKLAPQEKQDSDDIALPKALHSVLQEMFQKNQPVLTEFDARVLKRSCVALATFLWKEIFGSDVAFARSQKIFNWGMYKSKQAALDDLEKAARDAADSSTRKEILEVKNLLTSKGNGASFYLIPIGGVQVTLQRNLNVKRQFDGVWFEIHSSFISCTVVEVKSGSQTKSNNQKQLKSAVIELNMGPESEVQDANQADKSNSVMYFTRSCLSTEYINMTYK